MLYIVISFSNYTKLFILYTNFTFQLIANKTMFHSQCLRDLQLLNISYSNRNINININYNCDNIKFKEHSSEYHLKICS